MPKLHVYQKIVFTFAVLALLAIGFYAYAWTDPSQTPPGGSVSSLIDSGATTQTKTGGLNVLGNLGVGTTNPIFKLDLQSTATNFSALGMGSSNQTVYTATILYSDSGNAQIWKAGTAYPHSWGWGGVSSLNLYNSIGPIAFHPNNIANVMYLANNGNIGIGTKGPLEKLAINGNIEFKVPSFQIRVKNDYSAVENEFAVIDFQRDQSEGETGNLTFNTGSSDGKIIFPSGNVGIGTTSPNTALDVSGALSARAITAPSVSPATQGRIYFDSTASKFKVSENGGAYQDLVGGAAGGGGWTDDGTVVRLAAVADKVGIGTASPASALHVNAQTGQYANDGSKPTMLLSYTGAIYANHYIGGSWDYFIDNPYNSTSNGGIHIKTAGTERLTISKGGNIGIGATSPLAKLDVNGAIKANNHLTNLPWKNFADPANGYIKLSTPIVHNESNMFSLRIFGYEYTGGSDPIDIQCVGYAYSATTLINARCRTEGTDLAVEMSTETRADQGGKTVVVIRIGTPTWDWYYPQLTAEYIGWKAKKDADFKWVTGETTPVQAGNTNNVVINDQTGNSWFNTSGNVGIGTTIPKQRLEVSGGIRLNTSTAKPVCGADLRGTIWFTQGGAGVKDAAEICAKDAAGAYAWRAVW